MGSGGSTYRMDVPSLRRVTSGAGFSGMFRGTSAKTITAQAQPPVDTENLENMPDEQRWSMLANVLGKLGGHEHRVSKVLETVDINKDGIIDAMEAKVFYDQLRDAQKVSELLNQLLEGPGISEKSCLRAESFHRIVKTFQKWSQDGTDSIPTDRISTILRQIYPAWSPTYFRTVLAKMDADGNGSVDCFEFCSFLCPEFGQYAATFKKEVEIGLRVAGQEDTPENIKSQTIKCLLYKSDKVLLDVLHLVIDHLSDLRNRVIGGLPGFPNSERLSASILETSRGIGQCLSSIMDDLSPYTGFRVLDDIVNKGKLEQLNPSKGKVLPLAGGSFCGMPLMATYFFKATQTEHFLGEQGSHPLIHLFNYIWEELTKLFDVISQHISFKIYGDDGALIANTKDPDYNRRPCWCDDSSFIIATVKRELFRSGVTAVIHLGVSSMQNVWEMMENRQWSDFRDWAEKHQDLVDTSGFEFSIINAIARSLAKEVALLETTLSAGGQGRVIEAALAAAFAATEDGKSPQLAEQAVHRAAYKTAFDAFDRKDEVEGALEAAKGAVSWIIHDPLGACLAYGASPNEVDVQTGNMPLATFANAYSKFSEKSLENVQRDNCTAEVLKILDALLSRGATPIKRAKTIFGKSGQSFKDVMPQFDVSCYLNRTAYIPSPTILLQKLKDVTKGGLTMVAKMFAPIKDRELLSGTGLGEKLTSHLELIDSGSSESAKESPHEAVSTMIAGSKRFEEEAGSVIKQQSVTIPMSLMILSAQAFMDRKDYARLFGVTSSVARQLTLEKSRPEPKGSARPVGKSKSNSAPKKQVGRDTSEQLLQQRMMAVLEDFQKARKILEDLKNTRIAAERIWKAMEDMTDDDKTYDASLAITSDAYLNKADQRIRHQSKSHAAAGKSKIHAASDELMAHSVSHIVKKKGGGTSPLLRFSLQWTNPHGPTDLDFHMDCPCCTDISVVGACGKSSCNGGNCRSHVLWQNMDCKCRALRLDVDDLGYRERSIENLFLDPLDERAAEKLTGTHKVRIQNFNGGKPDQVTFIAYYRGELICLHHVLPHQYNWPVELQIEWDNKKQELISLKKKP